MEQKFVSFDEALAKLGLSSDRLNELRENGQLRAYRDGSSWKFRSDEIEAMVEGGVPEPPPPSDIGLVDPQELVEASPLDADNDDSDLKLVEESPTDLSSESAPVEKEDSEVELELDSAEPDSQGSELDLAALEDTVTTDASDLVLDSPEEPGDSSDSILLSEEELGESVGGSHSTVIGKSELESEEADLELATDDDVGSDVSLASDSGASDVLSPGIAGSGVLDELTESSGGLSAFEDLEELEIDLSAESSRILSSEDVEKIKSAQAEAASSGDSDLTLDEEPDAADDPDMGSTDVPLEELEPEEAAKDEDSGLDLDLGEDLLDDGSGSDITLDSGDSGINLVSPSDSGLALDDIPLEMGGSAILSSLSLEGSDPEISLIAGESDAPAESEAELQTDDDFQLTPLSEGTPEPDGDSSSQVIALDAEIEDLGEEASGVLEGADFTEEADAGVMLSEDFAESPADDLGVAYAEVGVGAAPVGAEQPYTVGNVILLSCCGMLLLLAGTMGIDLVRNMWSWDENLSINSSLMDAILSLLP
ncbi:MAG: hypothetical protein MI725_16540 [Pirellulales bacterium]|nr:hypothetical protein [Pirellulales bacterium]